MGIIIRQSIKSALASFVGIGLSGLTIILLYPRFLSLEEIGIISFLEAVSWMFASLGSLAVNQISDRFFPFFKTKDKKHRGYLAFLMSYQLIGFIITTLVLLIFYKSWIHIYAQNSPRAIDFFFYVIPFVFFIMFHNLGDSFARVHLRTALPTFFREIILKSLIFISLVLYGFNFYSFETLIILRIIAYALVMLAIYLYLVRLKVFFWKNPLAFLNKTLLKKILIFAAFILIGGLGSLVVNKLDMLMIPALLDTSELGIYTIAFFMGTIVEIPRKTIGQISTPIIAQAWAENNIKEISKLYRSSAINQSIAGSLIFLLIWLNAKDIFSIIPNGEKFISGLQVILLIGLTRLVSMLTGLSQEILLQSKYYRFNLFALFILAFFNFYLNLWLIPIMGIQGAALATFIAFSAYSISLCLFIWFKIKIQPLSIPIFIVIILDIVLFFLIPLISFNAYPILNIILKSILIAGIFGATVLLFNLSPEGSALFEKLLSLVKSKVFGENKKA